MQIGLTSYLNRSASEVGRDLSLFFSSDFQCLVKARLQLFLLGLHLLKLLLISCDVLLLKSDFPVELFDFPRLELELAFVRLLVGYKLLDHAVFVLEVSVHLKDLFSEVDLKVLDVVFRLMSLSLGIAHPLFSLATLGARLSCGPLWLLSELRAKYTWDARSNSMAFAKELWIEHFSNLFCLTEKV